MKYIIMAGLLVGLFSSQAFAKTRRNYSTNYSTNYTPSYSYVVNSGSDQERCEAEANYMAANHISGHVWSCIGSFEGVGVGYSPNCNTCTPSNGMRLTGDASAQDNNGRWYRVRSWR